MPCASRATVQDPVFDFHGNSKWVLTRVNASLSPFQFSSGPWHHATYFLQRVTTCGYQEISLRFSAATDTNIRLRFGTLSFDGVTAYLLEVRLDTPQFRTRHGLP